MNCANTQKNTPKHMAHCIGGAGLGGLGEHHGQTLTDGHHKGGLVVLFPNKVQELIHADIGARYSSLDNEDFLRMNALVREHQPLDFSPSLPDFNPTASVLQAIQSVGRNEHLYGAHPTPSDCRGEPRLRAELSQLFSPLMRRTIDADNEIVVTNGAIQALYLAAKSFLKPGDEVILFEPFYHEFHAMLHVIQASPVAVPLRTSDGQTARQSNDLTYDRQQLVAAYTNRTKMFYLNNPTGKTFTEEELLFIGQLCEKHDVIILADDAYQFHNYGVQPHIRIATLPGMWKRTLTVGSGGKAFYLNSWRLGWLIGLEELLRSIRVRLYYSIQSVPRVGQLVLRAIIETETLRLNTNDSYFSRCPTEMLRKRDRFIAAFDGTGVDVIKPNAGYKLWTNPGQNYYSKQHKHLAQYVLSPPHFYQAEVLEQNKHILKQMGKFIFGAGLGGLGEYHGQTLTNRHHKPDCGVNN
ncbi:unnamed protein product [Medioppia subpectinata]|uniref:kynurenine--oxoglutarate transaminase n=1 Tax=Medioppia subpectinata TaxID=1979941 RepID=A0A7R9KPX2_9ACAR|nr:unnamed protein product [Medioppia subpectinata]CAG2106230.1 unnamed protein product [Medioppia subpectinata]